MPLPLIHRSRQIESEKCKLLLRGLSGQRDDSARDFRLATIDVFVACCAARFARAVGICGRHRVGDRARHPRDHKICLLGLQNLRNRHAVSLELRQRHPIAQRSKFRLHRSGDEALHRRVLAGIAGLPRRGRCREEGDRGNECKTADCGDACKRVGHRIGEWETAYNWMEMKAARVRGRSCGGQFPATGATGSSRLPWRSRFGRRCFRLLQREANTRRA